MLACRACRVALSAIAGCALCDPVRQNLVVVGEQEEERPSLPAVGADLVRALESQIRRVKDLLKKEPDDLQAAGRLIALANSAAKVIGEVRKLQDDGKKAIESMSFAERAELFIEWYGGLAPAFRTHLRNLMTSHEDKLAAPVEETLS
jgi:hypothetical protein